LNGQLPWRVKSTMEWNMRAALLGLAAAAIMATSAPVSPVSAQGVSVEGPGVGVRIGERDRWRDRDWRDRDDVRIHRRERFTVGGEGCRTVTVRERRPNGTLVVRRKSTC